jgi:DNA-binding Lrp family transcriptional regulator
MRLSRLEDFEWMLHYLKILDSTNAKIIEGLGAHDPKNISSLARSVGLPSATVAFRIKKLMRQGYLRVRAKLNSPELGLMKSVLFAHTKHGFEDKLLKLIQNLGYWTYIAPCYGKFNGFYTVFSFPALHKEKLEEYLSHAKELGIVSDYVFHWTTNIYEVAPNFEWFDFTKKAWSFSWKKWVEEVLKAPKNLPNRLRDPSVYTTMVDETDLLILKEMEKDGTIGFTELADVVGITPQGIRHRYYQHIVKKGLIVEYEISIFPYPVQSSDLCSILLDFENEEWLAKFINTLSNKPFILNYAKVIGRNSLVAHSYTPKIEFPNFLESLNRLAETGALKDFFYVNLDVASFKRQTVSYEYFHDGRWTYNSEETIKRLSSIVPLKIA